MEDFDAIITMNKDLISLLIEMEANGWILRKNEKIIIKQEKLASQLIENIAEIFSDVEDYLKTPKEEYIENGISEDLYEEYLLSSCMLYNMCLMLFGEYAKNKLPAVYFKVRCVEKNDELFEIMHRIEEAKNNVQHCMDRLNMGSSTKEEEEEEEELLKILKEIESDKSKETGNQTEILDDEQESLTSTSEEEEEEASS